MAIIMITNKMKVFSFILLFFGLLACTQQTNPKKRESYIIENSIINLQDSNIVKDEGVKFLKDFYLSYFKINLSSLGENEESNKIIYNSTTKKLYDEMFNGGDEYDLDAGEGYYWIIQSQDFFDEWIDTLHVFQDKESPNIYYVSYSNSTAMGPFSICIKLALVKENGHYLIDQIFKDESLDCRLIEESQLKSDLRP